MPTPTPRTDAAFSEYIASASPIPFRDFARQLEAEIAQLTAERAELLKDKALHDWRRNIDIAMAATKDAP